MDAEVKVEEVIYCSNPNLVVGDSQRPSPSLLSANIRRPTPESELRLHKPLCCGVPIGGSETIASCRLQRHASCASPHFIADPFRYTIRSRSWLQKRTQTEDGVGESF